jgi:hypothetical protein
MYSSLAHLQTAIRISLEKGPVSRIYNESLIACWPHVSDDVRTERIAQFAAQNHWSVALRNLGALGLVAEFQKLNSLAEF